MAYNKKRLDELASLLSKESGVKISFYGSNGKYCTSDIVPFSQLMDYQSARIHCVHIEGIIRGIKYQKQQPKTK